MFSSVPWRLGGAPTSTEYSRVVPILNQKLWLGFSDDKFLALAIKEEKFLILLTLQ
jgi:hypothetical protein